MAASKHCIRVSHRTRIDSGPNVLALLVAIVVLTLPSVSSISGTSTRVPSGSTHSESRSSSSSSSDADTTHTQGKRRGKILEERFNEYDLLQAYEEIKSEYYKKAFGGRDRPENGEFPVDDQQNWKLLVTMDPNKKKKKKNFETKNSNNNNNDDEIIEVSMLEHASDPLCPYVKMETVIPMSVEKCWDFLSLDRWDETMPKMDPFYEGLDVYGQYSVRGSRIGEDNNTSAIKIKSDEKKENGNIGIDDNIVKMILARKRTKRILAFGKREFVFVSVEDIPLEDGTWVSGTVSVEVRELDAALGDPKSRKSTDDDSTSGGSLPLLRRNKSYTRAFQDSIAFYKPLPPSPGSPNGRTKLTIVCRIDLNDSSGEHGSGGCIPMWLYVKTIGITGARSVLNMRTCLLEGDKLG